jgi:hypothetical protein
MARKQHSPEIKAAVMAALLEGQTVSWVAKEYKIPRSTIRSWKYRIGGVAKSSPQKKEAIGDKLIELLFVQLDTLKKQYTAMGDPDWIKLQSAADMAVLTGVTLDKNMRMLEAFGHDDDNADDSAPEN